MISTQSFTFMTRRRFFTLCAAAGSVIGPSSVLAAGRSAGSVVPGRPEKPIIFEVLLANAPIGKHVVEFRSDGDVFEVHTQIDIQVKILGVLLFNYQHTGVEAYDKDRLITYESQTVDDDSEFFVKARSVADGFEIINKKGRILAPADIWVASYWTPRVLTRTELIDPQRGKIKTQRVGQREPVTLKVGGSDMSGTRYRISGVVNGTVVYDDQGQWIGATLIKKGSDIVYRLKS